MVIVRHAPPVNTVFAELAFPPSVFAADSGGEVTVRVRARAGVYGLDIETSSRIGQGATVTFTYPRYFSAPPEARQKYGSDAVFERALAVGYLGRENALTFLPSTRPAADHLRAALTAAGTYIVAAPR